MTFWGSVLTVFGLVIAYAVGFEVGAAKSRQVRLMYDARDDDKNDDHDAM